MHQHPGLSKRHRLAFQCVEQFIETKTQAVRGSQFKMGIGLHQDHERTAVLAQQPVQTILEAI